MFKSRRLRLILPLVLVVGLTAVGISTLLHNAGGIEEALPVKSLHKQRDFYSLLLNLREVQTALAGYQATPGDQSRQRLVLAVDILFVRKRDNQSLYDEADIPGIDTFLTNLRTTVVDLDQLLQGAGPVSPSDLAQIGQTLEGLAVDLKAKNNWIAQELILQASYQREKLQDLRSGLFVVLILLGGFGLALAVLLVRQGRTITKLREQNELIEKMSVTDALTGLSNRSKLDRRLADELSKMSRFGHPVSIILLDIDHFKQVNDNHGHDVGDRVLIDIAELLRHSVRTIDLAGRWGGEEFLVICPSTTAAGAVTLAEKIRGAFEAADFEGIGRTTASLGVAMASTEDTPASLLKKADTALYSAKHAGRNRVVIDPTALDG